MINIVRFQDSCIFLACAENYKHRYGYGVHKILSNLLTESLISALHTKVCEALIPSGYQNEGFSIFSLQEHTFKCEYRMGSPILGIKKKYISLSFLDEKIRKQLLIKAARTNNYLYIKPKFSDKVRLMESYSKIYPTDLMLVS